ncbi:MAG: methionyl-tRNA formyltransferase [Minwuia sp.]|nr:methionyl-tRNA formyltransferase [Minwuia sp.]
MTDQNAAPQRIIFMGTPDFAVAPLRALHQAGHRIVCVYCQPPRAAGRGKKPRPSPVQQAAEELGLPVRSPLNFRNVADRDAFAGLEADLAVVAAYGLILPQAILDAPRLGCFNIHASLLPRWRGAAPIHRAIMAGDTTSGITIMRMEAGLDTGPMLMVDTTAISADDTTVSLHDRLATMGADLIVPAVAAIAAGTASETAQPMDGVTYAAKIDKAEARIDWSQDAAMIERLIRALTPFPGAWFELDGHRVKVHAAHLLDGQDTDAGVAPGTTVDDALGVQCGQGRLRLTRLQRAGKGPVNAADMLNGRPIPAGTSL